MNQKNLEYLTDQLKYTGFGDAMQNVLSENLQKGEAEFKIDYQTKYGGYSMNASLNFKKSDQNDIYFFNSYKAILQKDQSKEGLEQIFYINKDNNNITLKEAYNLLDGRAVNKDLKTKEGEVYNAWLKIDFKDADTNGNFKINHYHQNYGYDLETSLSKHPIKELKNSEFRENLISSLKKGNIQSVTFLINGTEKKQFIEANPHFKNINVYDGSMQRVNNRESKEQRQGNEEEKSKVKDKKTDQDVNTQESDAGERKNLKKKRISNSI